MNTANLKTGSESGPLNIDANWIEDESRESSVPWSNAYHTFASASLVGWLLMSCSVIAATWGATALIAPLSF